MLRRLKPMIMTIVLLALAPVLVVFAQDTCPDIVKTALAAASQACANTGRNQACYGNVSLTASPQPGVQNFAFSKTGDIVDVSSIQSLVLSPMDESAGKWGVALMKLQANLPDTLPGENVTFLLFGDAEIINGVTSANALTNRPMQTFYLRTGVQDAKCEQSPQSGMLVQTPKGVGEVTFNVNGVDVQMGSTVFFQAQPKNQMTVSTLEGAAYITARDKTEVIVPGTWAGVPLSSSSSYDILSTPSGGGGSAFVPPPYFQLPGELITQIEDLLPSDAPQAPRSYSGRLDTLQSLPVDLLGESIDIAAPLTDEQVQQINDKLSEGVVCGEDPLPACPTFHLPDGTECVMPPPPGQALPADETRPLCSESIGSSSPSPTPADEATTAPDTSDLGIITATSASDDSNAAPPTSDDNSGDSGSGS